MTPFSFEHDFLRASKADLIAAYFDPMHQVEQDRVLEIRERELVEFDDRPDQIRRVSRIVPKRQLPAVVRAFSSGPLHYLETVTWIRRRDAIDIELRLFGGRGRVAATYALEERSPGSIRRRYTGEVSVDVALVSGRVERGIVAEFERSLARAAACTQGYLDRQSQRFAAARA